MHSCTCVGNSVNSVLQTLKYRTGVSRSWRTSPERRRQYDAVRISIERPASAAAAHELSNCWFTCDYWPPGVATRTTLDRPPPWSCAEHIPGTTRRHDGPRQPAIKSGGRRMEGWILSILCASRRRRKSTRLATPKNVAACNVISLDRFPP